jgi:hypothetical protein
MAQSDRLTTTPAHHLNTTTTQGKAVPRAQKGQRKFAPSGGDRSKVVAVSAETVEEGGRTAPPSPWRDDFEAAVYVRKTPRWMREQAERRAIPFHYAGRKRVWHVADLDAYLRGRRVEAVAR